MDGEQDGRSESKKEREEMKALTEGVRCGGRAEVRVERERWKTVEGERSCESPSSDNKAFPMTPPSGQELKPGNRTQRPRRRDAKMEGWKKKKREAEMMEKIRESERENQGFRREQVFV